MSDSAFAQSMQAVESRLGQSLFVGLLADLDEDTQQELVFELGLSMQISSLPAQVVGRQPYCWVEPFAAEQALVQQGENTTLFYVVLAGQVASTYAAGGLAPAHRTYAPGEWFGETSALSHQPALSTCRAVNQGQVLVIEQRLFRRIYDNDDEFQGRINEVYLRDHLALHLGAATFLRDLDPGSLKSIAQTAELIRLEAEDELFEQGDEVDKFYLVRAGALRVDAEREDGGSRVLAFYRGNSSFGEHSLVMEGATWPGTAMAETDTDLVAFPVELLRRVAVTSERTMTRAGNLLLADQQGVAAAEPAQTSAKEEVHVMLDRQSVKGGRALVIELDKCIRCNLCVESCVSVHEDRIPRISKVGTRVAQEATLITACYHCDVPGCMEKCGYGAIRRTAQGQVQFEYDNCVGCAQCIDGCPYGVIRYVEPFDPGANKAAFDQHWLRSIPFIGKWLAAEPEPGTPPAHVMNVGGSQVEVSGKTVKCDLCAGLPFEACVYNCPTSAIHRRAPEQLFR